MNLETALDKLRPGSSWSLQTSEYEDVIWLDENTKKPSKEEVEEKIHELQLAEPMKLLRMERDQLLSQSDWRDLPSYPGSNQEAWRTYRQQLRDLPSTTDPSNPTWPTAPEND